MGKWNFNKLYSVIQSAPIVKLINTAESSNKNGVVIFQIYQKLEIYEEYNYIKEGKGNTFEFLYRDKVYITTQVNLLCIGAE